MIRINLLAVERERTKRRAGALIPAAQRVTIGASLILLATALGIGWWWWSLRQTTTRLDEDIRRSETQLKQLQSVLDQVRKFEANKASLQQRVTVIEQLRQGQSGPVRVIDEISKAVPEYLWLTEIVQKGDLFTISGMSTSLPGLSDFIKNLEASAWFKEPIDIVDSAVDQTQKAAEVVRFSIKATFVNPELPAAPAPGAPAATAGRGAAPPR
jgi:type IV pilus assembly protein PilN